MCLRGQGRSVKSDNAHVKMGTTNFNVYLMLDIGAVHSFRPGNLTLGNNPLKRICILFFTKNRQLQNDFNC